jgi:hypothetical protein
VISSQAKLNIKVSSDLGTGDEHHLQKHKLNKQKQVYSKLIREMNIKFAMINTYMIFMHLGKIQAREAVQNSAQAP